MKSVCKENGISREVLLEALFQHHESDLAAGEAILKEAKLKGEHRQHIENDKRAQSMMQREVLVGFAAFFALERGVPLA